MDHINMVQLIKFMHLAEKLKIYKRRSRTSDGNLESIADHCWRVSLLVLICHRCVADGSVSLEKSLKMAIVHDLVEAITGDVPSYKTETDPVLKKEKTVNELSAIKELSAMLPGDISSELSQIWKEFEFGASNESKFVKAIDRIEGQIQFNESDIKYWNEHDIEHAGIRLNDVCQFDSFLVRLGNQVQEESQEKVRAQINNPLPS